MPISGNPASVPNDGDVVALAHTNVQFQRAVLERLDSDDEEATDDPGLRTHLQRLRHWHRQVKPLMACGLVHLGGWTETEDEDGNAVPLEEQVTEISANLVINDLDIAERMARTQDQKAIFNLSTFETTPTGGRDRMPWRDGSDADFLRDIAHTLPDALRFAYGLDDDQA